MGTLLIALIAGVAAGAATARTIVRRELREFAERSAAMQPPAAPPPPQPAPIPVAAAVAVPTPTEPDELTPEVLAVLTAAVAAFLGKRAKIRSIRPRPAGAGSAWAQQGRVFVQASHNLPLHR